ncbi:MAG: ribonuclease H family protein, partial [Cyanobacteria bacterium J06638_38]
HRQALIRASRAMGSTATVALEVISNTIPIQCRLDIVLEMEFCKILAKQPEDHLKQEVLQGMAELHIPRGKNINQLHILRNTLKRYPHQESLTNIEQEQGDSLLRLTQRCAESEECTLGLGTAGTRNSEQTSRAKTAAEQYISQIPIGAVIFYTDGSALGNPGPCGAAAIGYLQGNRSTPITLSKPVAKIGTSYHAELVAIQLAVNFIVDSKAYDHSRSVYILSDCQAAITSVCSANIHRSHQNLIDTIRGNIHDLLTKGLRIKFNWIAGHVDLAGNELADAAAKAAAENARELPASEGEVSLNTVKNSFKRQAKVRWQNMWNLSSAARILHDWIPEVGKFCFPKAPSRQMEVNAIRITTGQTRLNQNMFRMKIAESPVCVCNSAPQTIEHVMYECKCLHESIKNLHEGLDAIYFKHDTPLQERATGVLNYAWPLHKDPETRVAISRLFYKFISSLDADKYKL